MQFAPTPTSAQIAENVERFERLRPQILAELDSLGKPGGMINEEFLDEMAELVRRGFVVIAADDRTFRLTERGAAAK